MFNVHHVIYFNFRFYIIPSIFVFFNFPLLFFYQFSTALMFQFLLVLQLMLAWVASMCSIHTTSALRLEFLFCVGLLFDTRCNHFDYIFWFVKVSVSEPVTFLECVYLFHFDLCGKWWQHKRESQTTEPKNSLQI